jgi:thymidylate synthase (FAD)
VRLIKPSFEILSEFDGVQLLKNIERYGRTCYKSEEAITDDSAPKFVKMLIDRGHESVLEHEKITVKFIIDRGVSHELVRHRIASYSQESTRYCNYANGQITFIVPPWVKIEPGEYTSSNTAGLSDEIVKVEEKLLRKVTIEDRNDQLWFMAMCIAEKSYRGLIQQGWKPEQARSVLPNSLKTEIVTTFNLREWQHFFKLRTLAQAHPQMREVSIPLLKRFQQEIPVMFDDIVVS